MGKSTCNEFYTFVLLSMFVSTLNLSCKSNHDAESEAGEEVVFSGREFEELKIPSPLWDLIESVYHREGKSVQGQVLDADAGGASIAINFYPIKVHLREKTSGVLRAPKMRFEFPDGGGLLDLADYVSGERRGTWYLRVEPMGLGDSISDLRVFYLSSGKARLLEGQKFGSGCTSYMEITSYYRDYLGNAGVRVNTSEGRYLSLLAGSYFFVALKDEALYISQLTVTDERFPALLCLQTGDRQGFE